jgi:hypothetical protein
MFDRPLELLDWEARVDMQGQPESVDEAIAQNDAPELAGEQVCGGADGYVGRPVRALYGAGHA